MRQTLCRRLEDLEKIAVAAAARRTEKSSDYEEKIARLIEMSEAWHADPVNQKWLAEQQPDYLHRSVQAFRAELEERANGRFRTHQAGGFR
jgi:hypothetical protein